MSRGVRVVLSNIYREYIKPNATRHWPTIAIKKQCHELQTVMKGTLSSNWSIFRVKTRIFGPPMVKSATFAVAKVEILKQRRNTFTSESNTSWLRHVCKEQFRLQYYCLNAENIVKYRKCRKPLIVYLRYSWHHESQIGFITPASFLSSSLTINAITCEITWSSTVYKLRPSQLAKKNISTSQIILSCSHEETLFRLPGKVSVYDRFVKCKLNVSWHDGKVLLNGIVVLINKRNHFVSYEHNVVSHIFFHNKARSRL